MLGKGLESLIPQKGNGNGSGNGSPNGLPVQPQTDPQVTQQPLPRLEPQPQAQIEPQPQLRPQLQQPQAEPRAPQAETRELPKAEKPTVFGKPREEASVRSGEPESIFHIEVERIVPNPNQPRRNFDEASLRDLANSIREFGFLQPLVVSKMEKETPSGVEVLYQLIAGERRFLAAKMLGLPSIPAIIRRADLEREKLELAVIENIQREDLSPIETARAFERLQEEFRMTQREIASKLGKSREAVANTMRLLDLPEYVREAVEKGQLSESHARLLLAIPDPGAQKRLFEDILQGHLTTRDVKERVHSAGSGARRGRPPKSEEHLPPELRALQDSLSSELGAPVEIHQGQAKGSITITFYSEEELRSIMNRFGKEI